MKEQVLVASRRKITMHTLTAGGLLAASLFVVIWGDRSSNGRMLMFGLLFAFILAFAFVGCLVSLVRPSRLGIGSDAFEISGLIRRRRIAWPAVQDFVVKKAGSPVITIRYAPAQGSAGTAKGGKAGLREEALPVGDFALSPLEIAQLLNEARREAITGRSATP